MKPPEQIATKRLVLRKPGIDDAFVLFNAYMQDMEVTRYTTWRPHRQLQETADLIRSSICAWENGTRFSFVITHKEENQPSHISDVPRDRYIYAIVK
jgi:[ribosomal protein S5]-alanine N-acetyltransferase